jgi:hypothetical protein
MTWLGGMLIGYEAHFEGGGGICLVEKHQVYFFCILVFSFTGCRTASQNENHIANVEVKYAW